MFYALLFLINATQCPAVTFQAVRDSAIVAVPDGWMVDGYIWSTEDEARAALLGDIKPYEPHR